MSRRTSQTKKERTTYLPAGATPYIYRVVIEPDEDRYFAQVPALPDCHSWGYTYEEALKNIKEALELWLGVMKEDGEPILVEDPIEPTLQPLGRGPAEETKMTLRARVLSVG